MADKIATPVADRRQHLRLFMSADLAGGTNFKNQRRVEGSRASASTWPRVFETFFLDFGGAFRKKVKDSREEESDHAWVAPPPRLWKINGDEIIFTELIYPEDEKRHVTLGTSLRAFVETVQAFDAELIPLGMGVRACAWTAGFPLRNKYLRIVDGNIDIIPGRTPVDPETGDYEPTARTVMDYIGRDIDLGFRLAALAPPKRVGCSFDIAQFVTEFPDQRVLTVHHVGWQPLKGILGGMPYPILWLEATEKPEPRHPWERDGVASDEVNSLLRGNAQITKDKFDALAKQLDNQFPQHMIRAYASSDHMPKEHRVTWWNANEPDDPTDDITAGETAAMPQDEYSVDPEQVETITMDDLNQILLYLQEEPDARRLLRKVLLEVAHHQAYDAWIEHAEYQGLLFRLHRSLAFHSNEERRLLERLGLVESDALRVKLHARGDDVFMTDGLWVSSAIRVFPFIDESDLVMKACTTHGLTDWATCVIDPAVGCGHNVLRYHADGCRRYGFDRSARAVAYAAINALINDSGDAVVGVNDIRHGIPPLFAAEEERVLVVANMPFSLVATPNTMARTSEGGRYGYELTVAMFDAVDRLAASLPLSCELRCVTVAYSIGVADEDTWVVNEKAIERFGANQVEWNLWEDENLWRVNGKKEEPNPMPLTALKRKADCQFYVRVDANRDKVRKAYSRLTSELKKKGYTHLGYGAAAVTHSREVDRLAAVAA